MGSWTTFEDGSRAWRSAPDGGGPGVLVLHPWWGLAAPVRTACDQLARHGFVALAPDLFGDGRVVGTVAEAEARVASEETRTAVGERARAGLAALLVDPARTGPAVGAVGFSLGAFWALTLAQERPEVVAAVVYYGTVGGPLSGSYADVLGHFAPDDPFETEADVAALERSVGAAGHEVTLHSYLGTRHWFAEPDRPEFDPAAATLAWDRTVRFLQARVR